MNIFKVLTDAVRGILFMIDSVVYGLIPTIYKLIISLANVNLYSNNPAISGLLNRAYIIIGIFMLFKLAFAVLRYIVDPGAFSDNSKGFTNLVKRVMIALILLVSIPFLFDHIYEYQGAILNSGALSRLILGEENYNVNDMDEAAVDLQFMMFGPFFSVNARESTPETEGNELEACVPNESRPLSNIIGSTDMALKDDCLEAFAAAMDKDSNVRASGSTLDKFFKMSGADNRNFNSLGGLLTWSLSDGEYAINYIPVISTICGGYLAFLLLSFCIDIATRAIKLLFLQILSPVAIITSIDPTSSSGNDKLKDWGLECLKTYISVFLRLIVIYTIIQMIYIITSKVLAGVDSLYYDKFNADASLNIWVYIFLILGAFAVAKKIPELIEKAFGIKFSGEINMNPFKTFSENTGFQKMGALAAGLGVGVAGAATGAGAGRILSGVYNGLKGKSFSEVQKTMVDGNRTMRNAVSDGSTFGGRMRARVTKWTGIQGALGKIEDEKVEMENEIHRLEGVKSDVDNQKQTMESSIMLDRETVKNNQGVISAIEKIKSRAISKAKQTDYYRNEMAKAESARLSAQQVKGDDDAAIATRENFLKRAREIEAGAEKWAATKGAKAWYDDDVAGKHKDGDGNVIYDSERLAATSDYNVAADTAGVARQISASNLWNQQDDMKIENGSIAERIAPVERAINEFSRRSDDISAEINAHQQAIGSIDQRHRQEESNYKPVGAQSGGPRVPNLTGRADAGQHYGPGGTFGGMPPFGGIPPFGVDGPGYRSSSAGPDSPGYNSSFGVPFVRPGGFNPSGDHGGNVDTASRDIIGENNKAEIVEPGVAMTTSPRVPDLTSGSSVVQSTEQVVTDVPSSQGVVSDSTGIDIHNSDSAKVNTEYEAERQKIMKARFSEEDKQRELKKLENDYGTGATKKATTIVSDLNSENGSKNFGQGGIQGSVASSKQLGGDRIPIENKGKIGQGGDQLSIGSKGSIVQNDGRGFGNRP